MLGVHRDDYAQDTGSKRRTQSSDAAPQENQRRHRREKYAVAACGECKKRKIRCSGDVPCRRCDSLKKPCVYSRGTVESSEAIQDTSSRCTLIEAEVRTLREQVYELHADLRELMAQNDHENVSGAQGDHQPSRARSRNPQPIGPQADSQRHHAPIRTQYLGPTSPDFSFNVANSTLNNLGIQPDYQIARLDSAITTRYQSPESSNDEALPPRDPLLSLSLPEVHRTLEIYKEEIHSAYPFVCVDDVISSARMVYQQLQRLHNPQLDTVNIKDSVVVAGPDISILKMMVAAAVVVKGNGQSKLGQDLLHSVEERLSGSMKEIAIDLKQLQLFTLTSIYHFHCDEEVLAWRTIGIAARIALEIGLHRRQSLEANVPEPQRFWGLRLFYCIYVLDRRWSFGTGMPFALKDSDIDPDLPPLGGSVPYLECMVSYGKIASRVWEAVDGFGNKAVDVDTVAFLDFQLQRWRHSIPEHLQLSISDTTRTELAPSRSLLRQQVLLYLKANHMQILVNRHSVLSALDVLGNHTGAQRVVQIAKDTIRLLVRLRETSTLYETQQSAFNYFLISALSAIFLAVCHAPADFSNSCRDEFFAALSLLKDLSSRSCSARRLWKSLRGLKSVAPRLGLGPRPEQQAQNFNAAALSLNTGANTPNYANTVTLTNGVHYLQEAPSHELLTKKRSESAWLSNNLANANAASDADFTIPDMFQMSSDLTAIFEAFGSDTNDQGNMDKNLQEQSSTLKDTIPLSTIFKDLI